MKNYSLFIAFLLLFSNCSTPDPEADKAEAMKLINGFYSAVSNYDYDLIRSYCTDNFYVIDDGKIYQNIDESIASLKTLEDDGADFKVSLEVEKADMYAKSALIVLKFYAVIKMGENEIKMTAIESYLLKKEAEKWLIDFIHSTPLKEND